MTGDEVTPRAGCRPHRASRRPAAGAHLDGDRQIHISSDVAYAVWQYWRATGDEVFMIGMAPMLLDTAVFWGCRRMGLQCRALCLHGGHWPRRIPRACGQ